MTIDFPESLIYIAGFHVFCEDHFLSFSNIDHETSKVANNRHGEDAKEWPIASGKAPDGCVESFKSQARNCEMNDVQTSPVR